MDRRVLEQVVRLGGEMGRSAGTVTEQLMSLRFEHALHKRPEPLPWDPSGLDTFRHPVRYEPSVFAPFTEGDPMFGELDGLVTEDALRQTFLVPEGPLEFVFVGTSDGFPNHYVVATGDRCPDNPSVFQTDHETFFRTDVDRVGSFADYLAGLVTA